MFWIQFATANCVRCAMYYWFCMHACRWGIWFPSLVLTWTSWPLSANWTPQSCARGWRSRRPSNALRWQKYVCVPCNKAYQMSILTVISCWLLFAAKEEASCVHFPPVLSWEPRGWIGMLEGMGVAWEMRGVVGNGSGQGESEIDWPVFCSQHKKWWTSWCIVWWECLQVRFFFVRNGQ